MLDDHKYSVGRLVVYAHTNPSLPSRKYGRHGHERTVGEILAVELDPNPAPHWTYEIRNIRSLETVCVPEDDISFATGIGKNWRKSLRSRSSSRSEDTALAEMIAKAIANPERGNILRHTIKDIVRKEEIAVRAAKEGADLPIGVGDYVRVRGDLRPETEPLHNHYAKILSVGKADIAGIENADAKPGMPHVYRTIKAYHVVTSEQIEADIYDAEIKLFYTAESRNVVLNWRAATLLAEAFGDPPPYNIDFEYIADHVYSRDELKNRNRTELTELISQLLYVKGKIGYRDLQRRNQLFSGTPKSHLIDGILETSRFDSKKNRKLSREEIRHKKGEYFKLRRFLKGK